MLRFEQFNKRLLSRPQTRNLLYSSHSGMLSLSLHSSFFHRLSVHLSRLPSRSSSLCTNNKSREELLSQLQSTPLYNRGLQRTFLFKRTNFIFLFFFSFRSAMETTTGSSGAATTISAVSTPHSSSFGPARPCGMDPEI